MTLEDEIDPTPFGFAKMKYAAIERERRWLCDGLPEIVSTSREVYVIEDLYIAGTQLRLRDASLPNGTPAWPRLARKVDVDASHRLITSIYLSPPELSLFKSMPGARLHKTRHTVMIEEQRMSIDQFSGFLTGLVLVEAEFNNDVAMENFVAPDWASREVTNENCFSGGHLSALSSSEAKVLVAGLSHAD